MTEKKYQVVMLALDRAYIVETQGEPYDFSKLASPIKVNFLYLPLRFCDIEEEARKSVESFQNGEDPELLFNPETKIEDLSDFIKTEEDKKLMEEKLEFFQTAPEDFQQPLIRDYRLAQTNPEKLYEELKQRYTNDANSSVIEQLSEFDVSEISYRSGGGFLYFEKQFSSLDDALEALNNSQKKIDLVWKKILALWGINDAVALIDAFTGEEKDQFQEVFKDLL